VGVRKNARQEKEKDDEKSSCHPGNDWEQKEDGWGIPTIESNRARIVSEQGLVIETGATGVLEISAYLDNGSLGSFGDHEQFRGVGLGFSSLNTGTSNWQGVEGFVGLVLTPTGSLWLREDPVNIHTGTKLASGVGTTGMLVYKVDTNTGDIFDITLNANPITDPLFSAFTPANTAYVSLYSLGILGTQIGYLDTFQLSGTAGGGVPEPSTLVLAGIGLLGLLACRRRRNHRRA
jgi:hypothetical protein